MKLVDLLFEGRKESVSEIKEDPQLIGRHGDIVTFAPITSVSRGHAKVYLKDGIPYLEDVGSKHGSLVVRNCNELKPLKYFFPLKNGERVELKKGDLIYLGYQSKEGLAYTYEVRE